MRQSHVYKMQNSSNQSQLIGSFKKKNIFFMEKYQTF